MYFYCYFCDWYNFNREPDCLRHLSDFADETFDVVHTRLSLRATEWSLSPQPPTRQYNPSGAAGAAATAAGDRSLPPSVSFDARDADQWKTTHPWRNWKAWSICNIRKRLMLIGYLQKMAPPLLFRPYAYWNVLNRIIISWFRQLNSCVCWKQQVMTVHLIKTTSFGWWMVLILPLLDKDFW